jgi:hypothetical protein
MATGRWLGSKRPSNWGRITRSGVLNATGRSGHRKQVAWALHASCIFMGTQVVPSAVNTTGKDDGGTLGRLIRSWQIREDSLFRRQS